MVIILVCLTKQKIPADTEYRKNVEAFTKYRRNIVQENEDVGVMGEIHPVDQNYRKIDWLWSSGRTCSTS